MSTPQKRELISPSYSKLSIVKQCKSLGLQKSSYYCKPKGESSLNQLLMRAIDKKYLECPFYGTRRMTTYLNMDLGYRVDRKRIKRLYRLMGLTTIYPKKNLSKPNLAEYKYPYLLKDLEINRPNQVWASDITYIPMFRGFMYMYAIIDVYSRKIVGWDVSNTMSVEWCKSITREAIEKYGKPEIFNTDQGSQFTSPVFINELKKYDIKISMDGKGRALDNIYIERFWRTIKYEHIYLYPANGGIELLRGIRKYIDFYNNERRHHSLNQIAPNNFYYSNVSVS
jgi:putative transposase